MKKNKNGIKKFLVIGAIGPDGWQAELEATPDECTAIAKRLDIPGITKLFSKVNVCFQDDLIRVYGHLIADLSRQCVVSLDVFPEHLDTDFEVLFAEDLPPTAKDTEMKEAVEPIDRGRLDFFEILAEQVGLLMDPFPRKPGVTGDYIEFSETKGQQPFANLKNILKKD